jgi:hypothetical protein
VADRRCLGLSACRLYRISVRVFRGPRSLKQVPIVLAAARCRGEPPRTSALFGSNCHRPVILLQLCSTENTVATQSVVLGFTLSDGGRMRQGGVWSSPAGEPFDISRSNMSAPNPWLWWMSVDSPTRLLIPSHEGTTCDLMLASLVLARAIRQGQGSEYHQIG